MPADASSSTPARRDPRVPLGRRGEEIATTYLLAQGYAIVTRNWRCRRGELDIVAQDGAWLVFVEVRTRGQTADGSELRAGTPEESVTPAKRARLAFLVEEYLYAHPWNGPIRVDVVALQLAANGSVASLNHLRDVVEGRA